MLYSSTCQICEIFPLMLYYSILFFYLHHIKPLLCTTWALLKGNLARYIPRKPFYIIFLFMLFGISSITSIWSPLTLAQTIATMAGGTKRWNRNSPMAFSKSSFHKAAGCITLRWQWHTIRHLSLILNGSLLGNTIVCLCAVVSHIYAGAVPKMM